MHRESKGTGISGLPLIDSASWSGLTMDIRETQLSNQMNSDVWLTNLFPLHGVPLLC